MGNELARLTDWGSRWESRRAGRELATIGRNRQVESASISNKARIAKDKVRAVSDVGETAVGEVMILSAVEAQAAAVMPHALPRVTFIVNRTSMIMARIVDDFADELN